MIETKKESTAIAVLDTEQLIKMIINNWIIVNCNISAECFSERYFFVEHN